MSILSEIFAWWGGNTWGTRWTIWKHGRFVGADDFGNRYYVQRRGVGPLGTPRRWVIYKNLSEASQVPPEWHGWLHHTFEEAPTVAPLTRREFEKDHLPNMTGTPLAYHPKGSLSRTDGPADVNDDYEAWSPEEASETA